jgi:nicotinamidase-related amidase
MRQTTTPMRLIVGIVMAATLATGCSSTTATSSGPSAPPRPPNPVAGVPPKIDPAHTALLVMDMEQGIVAMAGPGADVLSTHIADAEQAAREVSSHNKVFSRIVGTATMIEGSPQTQFDPRIAPAGDEPVITKHRVGAFGSTSLDQILRAHDIDTIVLTGIATSGVVLSTLRVAADLDYRVIVLSDCVADTDSEVNRVLLDKVFPTQADVIDSGEFIRSLSR